MTSRPRIWAFGAVQALWAGVKRFNNNAGWVLSSHVAMSMMLALFPFILFVVALAGAISRDVDINELIELVFGAWPPSIADPIVKEIRAVIDGGSLRLMTFGGLLALYFASNGVEAVRIAITQAYRDYDPRPFWKTRPLAILYVLIGGAGLLVALTASYLLPIYLHLVEDALPVEFPTWLGNSAMQTVITLSVLVIGVTGCHVLLPGLRHKIREVWPGVVLTLLLWIAAVRGFSLYLSYFNNYSATYAGLAGAMAALIFLYLMAAILILGAEFNGALIRQKRKQSE